MMARRSDDRAPVERAMAAAARLKPGTWAAVEALAVLALEATDPAERASLLDRAHTAAARLSEGTWESVRALAWLARADRELS